MGIIGTTMGSSGPGLELEIRNTFWIIRIGVITATDSGITTGDIVMYRNGEHFISSPRLTHRRLTIIRECSTDAPVQLQLKLART